MLRFASDQDFDGRILAGLRRSLPGLDVERIYDIGLSRAEDPAVLEWAAGEERVLLTHDLRTMRGFAYERVAAGLPMPGVSSRPCRSGRRSRNSFSSPRP